MKHLIGAGHVAEKQLRYVTDRVKIYDNNEDLQGTFLHGHKIYPVELLKDEIEGEIIICTTSVNEILAQLDELKITLSRDVADDVREFQGMVELENFNPSFLLASGLPSRNIYGAEGGLYQIHSDGQNIEIERAIANPCHGIIKDHYTQNKYVTDQHDGLLIVDSDLTILEKIKLEKGVRPHGVSYNDKSIVVVCSNDDSIRIIDKQTFSTHRVPLSDKFDIFHSAQHHANDVHVIENFAYVSMFSITGNWKRGLFDGGIIEVNLLTEEIRTVISGLKLPHSVRVWDGNIIALNSYAGEVFSTSTLPKYKFNGFLRGFSSHGQYMILGESRNRNSTSLMRENYPSSIDSKITIVDILSHSSRSIALPQKISEIHAIEIA